MYSYGMERLSLRKGNIDIFSGKNNGLLYLSQRSVQLPSVKNLKQWKWQPLKDNVLRPLLKEKQKAIAKAKKFDKLPSWYHGVGDKKMDVIFIQNMDEYIAGQQTSIPVGLYRNWLYPHKIALAATNENISKYQHLNKELRSKLEKNKEMKQMAADISQYRMELRLKKDENTNEIYSKITKSKIARQLLVKKSILIDENQIAIFASKDESSPLDFINEEGSYQIKLLLHENTNLDFRFRLNARSMLVSKETRNKPFDWKKENESDRMPIALRKQLNKQCRSKRAHYIIDDIFRRNDGTCSRYDSLYNDIIKIKLSSS